MALAISTQLELLKRAERTFLQCFDAVRFADPERFIAGFCRPNDSLLMSEVLSRLAHHAAEGSTFDLHEIAAGRTYCDNFYVGAPWLSRTIAILAPGTRVTASDGCSSLVAVVVTDQGVLDSLPLPLQSAEARREILQNIPAVNAQPVPLTDLGILERIDYLNRPFRSSIEHRINRPLTSADRVYIRPDLDTAVEACLSPMRVQSNTNYLHLSSEFRNTHDLVMGRFLYSPSSQAEVDAARISIEPCLKRDGAALICFDRSAALGHEQVTIEHGRFLANRDHAQRIWSEGLTQATPNILSLLTQCAEPTLQIAAIGLVDVNGLDTPEIRSALREISKREDPQNRHNSIAAGILLRRIAQPLS